MTGIIVLRQSKAAHIVSDGAVYEDSGKVLFFAPKVVALPHINAVFTMRGAAIGLPFLAEILAAAVDYEDLKKSCVERLGTAIEMIRKMTISEYGQDAQLFVAGHSKEGPDAFTVLTSETNDVPADTVIPIQDLCMAPGDDHIHREVWSFIGGKNVDEIDPASDGLRIMEAQRRNKMRLPDGKRVFGIGGFVQLTTVTADAVSTRILRRWPGDRVGEVLTPNKDQNN